MIYIYFMKTKLIRFFALASLVFFFNGCTPDEVETTQDQFKPLIIRVTLADPIVQSNELNFESNVLNVGGSFVNELSLDGSVPNQVGQNTIEVNTTAVANSPIYLGIVYVHMIGWDGVDGIYQCNTVNLQIIYDGQTVFNESKQMGSDDGTCGDGLEWDLNVTLP